jgi:DNA-binding response OmpR family regulator
LPGAGRLFEAVAAGSNDFLLTSSDGSVAARVRLRLADAATTSHEIGGRAFTVDWPSGNAERRGRRVALSRTELRLLAALLQDQGGVVSRSELMDRLWPDDELSGEARENALAVYVGCLRNRLAALGLSPAIEAVRAKGYRLVPGDRPAMP